MNTKIKELVVFYGNKTELSKAMNIQLVTISRWLNGEYFPQGANKRLLEILYEQAKETAICCPECGEIVFDERRVTVTECNFECSKKHKFTWNDILTEN